MEKNIGKKQKILIVDDSEMNRAILADMLENEFEILEAANGKEAIILLHQQATSIDLVLLDIVMPEMDGFEVLAMMNKYHWIEDIPVIMISAENASTYMERAYDLGVSDYISRPFEITVVRHRVRNTIMLYEKQRKLIGLVTEQIYEKEKRSKLMISVLSHIVEFRNGESGLHVLHIQVLTELLLEQLMKKTDRYAISPSEASLIGMASSLHDIGKIAIPDEILNKPGRLTREEFETMKTHSLEGTSMLEKLPFYQGDDLVKIATDICRWHHERYDGKGYPDGLVGDDIPISAQIVSLADVYDALTSKRVYKDAYSHEQAMKMILNGECGTFNPLLLECLQDLSSTLQTELNINSLETSDLADTQHVLRELHTREELSSSRRALELLEYERIKAQFYHSLSREIEFEFTKNPPILTLCPWAAKKLGLPEIILDPHNNKQVQTATGSQNLLKIMSQLRSTTPEEPVAEIDINVPIDGISKRYHIVYRSIWSEAEPPQYLGSIGKVIDVHEARKELNELQHAVARDALTGLLNPASARKKCMEILQQNPLSHYALILLDLDHFRDANSRFGHLFGDCVLKYLGSKLQKCIRSTDLAARVGGDEFMIFLRYDSNLDGALNRIYNSLVGEYDNFPISISMGVAKTIDVGSDYDALFTCADQALYAVKHTGRGKYCLYDTNMSNLQSVVSPIDHA